MAHSKNMKYNIIPLEIGKDSFPVRIVDGVREPYLATVVGFDYYMQKVQGSMKLKVGVYSDQYGRESLDSFDVRSLD